MKFAAEVPAFPVKFQAEEGAGATHVAFPEASLCKKYPLAAPDVIWKFVVRVVPAISNFATGDVVPSPTLPLLKSPYMSGGLLLLLAMYNLLEPVSVYPALYPKKTFPLPVLLFSPAIMPTAVLLLPDEFNSSVPY